MSLAGDASLVIAGLSAIELKEIARALQYKGTLPIGVFPGDLLDDRSIVIRPMAGAYAVDNGSVCFRPRFRFVTVLNMPSYLMMYRAIRSKLELPGLRHVKLQPRLF